MLKRSFYYITFLLVLLLLSACGASAPPSQVKKRYFFPPSPAEPKLEYLHSYFSDKDLEAQEDALVKYLLGELKAKALFSSPVDVASDGKGRVFVADSGERQVFVMDLVNRSRRKLSFTSAKDGQVRGFGSPYSVTVADDGKVYVCDLIARSVDVFSSDEKHLFSFGDPGLTRPTAVAVDEKNQLIYVVDTANHRLAIFDLRGRLINYFGVRGEEPGQFNFPTDVDLDDQGHVYVLDALNARVQVFDEKGVFLRMFGERGTAEGSFEMPKNLAVDRQGRVYVTDALAHKVVIFSSEGELLLRIGGKSVVRKGVAPGGFYLPRGLDADDSGGLWVVDSLNRMVHEFQLITPEYLLEHPIIPEAVVVPASLEK